MSHFTAELAAARSAQQTWYRRPVRERLSPVRVLRNLLVERTNELLAAVQADIGKPPVETLGGDLLPTAAGLKFLEQRAAVILAPQRVSGRLRPTWLMGSRDVIYRRPWGVVGIIGTWNYPVFLNMGQLAQAVVAGNAVLWKPSEVAPRTADLIHQLFLAAGFPRDLIQKLPATREAGPQLAEAEVDYLVFTGSESVGRKLATRLGERLVPSTLELSGCDAQFVLADANIELAAKAAWFGVTLNRGQTCIAVRRIFVHRSRQAELTEALRKLLPTGKPMELVLASQSDQARRLVDDAVARGATPLVAGQASASGFPATLLLNTPPDAAFCREACFAPVAAVIPFDTLDEAVAAAAQSPFGLGASIFTADPTAARELAARVPAGHVTINDVLAPTAHPATPFGGRGASGWGVTQGADGLLGMTVPQAVTVRTGTFRPHYDEAITPDPATVDMLQGLLRWTHACRLGEKLRGLWQLIRGVWKKK
jgi:acyl-CoA reductase-like NAD-dependent aldehyde dehydrogenase